MLRESSCGWGKQLAAGLVLQWKHSLSYLLKWPPQASGLTGLSASRIPTYPWKLLPLTSAPLSPGILLPVSTLSGRWPAGSQRRRAHTAWSCVPFRWGLCVRPNTFLEGPVFLTAAFPVADTQKVPGRQEHVHGCWWCRARPAGTGRPGVGAGWLQAGQTGGGTECWARLPGSTSRPPPFPPPEGKERLINQLLWATKQNKSH